MSIAVHSLDDLPHNSLSRQLATSVVGSAAFGAAVAAGHGAHALLQGAWGLPVVILGGAALGLPPLYLFTALSGGRASAAELVERTGAALDKVATVLLGLAAPAAFFSITLRTPRALALLLGTVAVMGATGVVLVARDTLNKERAPRARTATQIWSLFALLLGARLMVSLGQAAGLWGRY